MYLFTTKEIILELKAAKAEKKLSIPGIQRMVEDTGVFIAINTLRNVFAKGAEDSSFSYDRTIRPIAKVLLPQSVNNGREDTAFLEKQLELLTNQLHAERDEHKRSEEFLRKQIDSLEKKLEQKDEFIKQLMDEYLKQEDING